MKKIDVICTGQAVIDCITRGQEADPHKPNVYRAERISLSTGGDAVNESFNLVKMGHAVRLVCGLGNDPAGSMLLAEAERRGVDTSGVTVDENLVTPIANLMVRKDGSRFSVNSTATRLDGYIPSPEAFAGARIVSFASLFRAPLDQPEPVKRLIRAAHEAGALVCADTKLPTFRNICLADLAEVLPLVDYIFPNEKEAEFHTGEKDFSAMAEKIHSLGIKNVIIKAGPEGCFASLQEGEFRLPAPKVPVVDTTGAGDSFVSGFLSGLLEGISQADCLKKALDCAGACVQHMGGA